MPGLLVIMGSGETAPTMVKAHRSIFERVGDRPAVLLDTPYGFQSNADDISARAVSYFHASVGRKVTPVSWRTAPPPGLIRERALAAINGAGWVFAGPGSPTYALRHWRGTPLEEAFVDVLHRDGVILMASAAALTLGSHTVPVYEIYKAGFDPYWDTGLDLVRRTCGLPVVVIPHYNNAEGGHHDTRYCYLGERRLSAMESSLPEDAFVLGVDEHTAVILDPVARTATVAGNGVMTVRRRGHSTTYPPGAIVDFEEMTAGGGGLGAARAEQPAEPDQQTEPPGRAAPSESALSLRQATMDVAERFEAAMARRDVDDGVEAILALEQVLLDWSADTLTSAEGSLARGRLRAMVVAMGELAKVGARDPRDVVGPFIEALLEERKQARKARDFATSDRIRDRLAAAGVEVRDTPTGSEWHLRTGRS